MRAEPTPVLVVANQTSNPAFNQWLAAFAARYGPVEFWSGNVPADLAPGVTVRRAPAYVRRSTRTRLVSWLRFALAVAWGLLWSRQRAPLLAVTNPPVLPLLAWALGRWQRRVFGLLEWDIYPQVLAAMGIVRPRHPLYRLWLAGHARALNEAAVVITLGRRLADTLRQAAGTPQLAVTVMPNWVDTGWLAPLPRHENELAQEIAGGAGLVVLYAGNLGATHAIETIVAVAEALAREPAIRFLLAGAGSQQGLVAEAIGAGRLGNTTLLPWQPVARLPLLLAAADVGIVTVASGYERLILPSKTYSLLAAGCALLGISRPPNDLADTIDSHACGANFGPEAVADIVAWLRRLLASKETLAQMRQAARAAAVRHYSAEACQARFSELVASNLLAQHGSQAQAGETSW